MNSPAIVSPDGEDITVRVPAIKAVQPFGSKILIEILKPDEILNTTLFVAETTETDGAPQAYVVELGTGVPENPGIALGQRIYWGGTAVPVNDPRAEKGRQRALLEIHNIKAIVEEE